LTSLTDLDLSFNTFTGTLPAEIGNLTSLTDLDLSYNTCQA
jgi:Leucine-rich repeat (LRR) protein